MHQACGSDPSQHGASGALDTDREHPPSARSISVAGRAASSGYNPNPLAPGIAAPANNRTH
eukprot:3352785-Prorocentrum_lima.AAC.1